MSVGLGRFTFGFLAMKALISFNCCRNRASCTHNNRTKTGLLPSLAARARLFFNLTFTLQSSTKIISSSTWAGVRSSTLWAVRSRVVCASGVHIIHRNKINKKEPTQMHTSPTVASLKKTTTTDIESVGAGYERAPHSSGLLSGTSRLELYETLTEVLKFQDADVDEIIG